MCASSLSSSPLWKPDTATLTFSVLDVLSTSHNGRHIGVGSSFLNSIQPGQNLHVSVRPAHEALHLPSDVTSTPVFMIGAGSGIAPFRGFIQERACQLAIGIKLAPALLFYGCREPGCDDLYSEELAMWETAGAMVLKSAYSRTPEYSKGHKYVQHILWAERIIVQQFWQAGARFYICGSKELCSDVTKIMVKIHFEAAQQQGQKTTKDEIESWWESLRNVRYVMEAFN